MNEQNTVRWLKYLLYVNIAALGNTLLSNFLPDLSNWLSPVLTLLALFMMARLVPSNGRYLRVVLFTGVSVLISVLNISQVALAGALCSIIGQYQEFTAHGELIVDRDPKLAGKWGSLFWLQFAVSIISTLLGSVFAAVLIASGSANAEALTPIITVAVALITLILKMLYLVYLRGTIKVLETEAPVE